jgi:GntR family transcriptional regulator, histidine utilization repressor
VDDKVTFRQVKQEVLARIRGNIWPPGALLPGEVDLAAEFGCARATVNRAMRELSDEGIIERRRKAGTRVKMSPMRQVKFEIPLLRVEIEATGAAYRYALVSREVVDAPDWLRARLALAPGVRLLHLECMHYADNAPFQFEDRWINLSAVPAAETADFSVDNPNEWLVRAVPFTDAAVRFSATAATDALARFMSVPANSPLFTVDRTTWISGQAVTNARLYHNSGYEMVALY